MHRVRGVPDPANHHAVREVRRGLRRTYGVAPVRQARPLTPADLRQILNTIDRTTPLGARDAAIILLGYASALRRSEQVALTLGDIEPKPGLLLHLRLQPRPRPVPLTHPAGPIRRDHRQSPCQDNAHG